MGYTHSWYRDERDMSKQDVHNFYEEFAELARQILTHAQKQGFQLADGFGYMLGEWEASADTVRFNGYGEDAHETFSWDRVCPAPQAWIAEGVYHDFCKTARKPYDTVVTAVLLAAREAYGDAVRIVSDGEDFEWEDGVRLFQDATGLRAKLQFDTVSV